MNAQYYLGWTNLKTNSQRIGSYPVPEDLINDLIKKLDKQYAGSHKHFKVKVKLKNGENEAIESHL